MIVSIYDLIKEKGNKDFLDWSVVCPKCKHEQCLRDYLEGKEMVMCNDFFETEPEEIPFEKYLSLCMKCGYTESNPTKSTSQKFLELTGGKILSIFEFKKGGLND